MTTTEKLLKQAQNAKRNAYAPYSKFHVGAAILDNNNTIHAGCNVENAAYPLGVCAEGSAISAMVLAGGKKITKILLISSGENLVSPCGGCRQKIKEFSDENTEIIIYHDKQLTVFHMDDLLPQSFSKKFLKA